MACLNLKSTWLKQSIRRRPIALNALLRDSVYRRRRRCPNPLPFFPRSLPCHRLRLGSPSSLRRWESEERSGGPRRASSPTAICCALPRQGVSTCPRARTGGGERTGISWRVRTIPLTRLHFLSPPLLLTHSAPRLRGCLWCESLPVSISGK